MKRRRIPRATRIRKALTLTPAATYAADLEEELRATRAAHAEERTALERTMAAKDEANAESTARMEKERERARAALRDAEMELQEALGDVTRLQRALAESKDANKSAEDVAAAESKMVDELRGRFRELEDEKGVLEARLRTATAEANGEADARADASADKRAAREDLAVLKGSLDSLRAELDGERAVAQKAERARAEVNGRLFQLTAEADGLRRRLASAKEECEAQRRSAEAARCLAKTAKKEEAPLREELAAVKENAEELVAELAATRLQLAASERSRKSAQKALTEKDEECAGAKADALRLDDEVKRLESELAKVGVAEKIREREALRALQEREWERGEANADHARVLRDATTRAEDAERECQSLRKRSEEAEARADAAENRTRDAETRIEHLERSAKDSARASKGSSLTAEINSALRQELEELGLELATAREETEARLAERDRVRADLKVQNEEFAKLEAALCRAEARAGDAEAAHAASARTVDSLRTELTQMARKIAELELAAEAAFVERSNLARDTEALERELAEVKTAKETLEGETWALGRSSRRRRLRGWSAPRLAVPTRAPRLATPLLMWPMTRLLLMCLLMWSMTWLSKPPRRRRDAPRLERRFSRTDAPPSPPLLLRLWNVPDRFWNVSGDAGGGRHRRDGRHRRRARGDRERRGAARANRRGARQGGGFPVREGRAVRRFAPRS